MKVLITLTDDMAELMADLKAISVRSRASRIKFLAGVGLAILSKNQSGIDSLTKKSSTSNVLKHDPPKSEDTTSKSSEDKASKKREMLDSWKQLS